MRLVSAEAMRQLEAAADARGNSYEAMMEQAGRAVATAIRERAPQGTEVLVLVGPGNNGGDGLVAARYLHLWGWRPRAYLWNRRATPDPNLERAQALGIPLTPAEDDPDGALLEEQAARAGIVLDALLGTGARGALRGGLAELLARVQRVLAARAQAMPAASPLTRLPSTGRASPATRPLVVAVDVPSGLDVDTGQVDEHTLTADLTVTFALPKRGQFLFPGAARVGELLVADIGIAPADAEALSAESVATADAVARLLPARPPDGNKGTFGKALVVAGSTNYVGAPRLCGEAAYRVGAGLVTMAVGGGVYRALAAKMTEATFLVLPDDLGALVPEALRVLEEHLEEYDALLLGPGLGREPGTGELVWGLLTGRRRPARAPVGFGVGAPKEEARPFHLPPLVIDADGLNLLAEREEWWTHLPTPCVLTPHPGEMARLLKTDVQSVQADRLGTAQQAARTWGCTVLLKGAYTVIAAPDGTTSVNPFANPAMATAGTGDVLAGTVLGLLAQGLGGYEAAVCGAYLHSLAGELARAQWGDAGLVAGDLLPLLPQALRQLR